MKKEILTYDLLMIRYGLNENEAKGAMKRIMERNGTRIIEANNRKQKGIVRYYIARQYGENRVKELKQLN